MNLEFPSMADYGLERSAKMLARAFENYFVQIPFTEGFLLQSARGDSVDLASSRVIVRDGKAIGGALVARRGWTCRLAAMAIVLEARRGGVGRAAVMQLLAEAKARGDRTMLLEVIEQNTGAVELYRACGFKEIRRLLGFGGPPAPDAALCPNLIEVDLREVAQVVTRYGLPDLPWQLSGETLAQLTPPSVAYRLDGAWLAITDPSEPVVRIRALIAEPAAQGLGREAALLRAVMAKHPGKEKWWIPALWPEELAPVVAPAGLPKSELTQWQMQREV
jgi:GNAT superfamily N-acetyltransferase